MPNEMLGNADTQDCRSARPLAAPSKTEYKSVSQST
jgi:hypothetical protein